jgi:hypothetical protein
MNVNNQDFFMNGVIEDGEEFLLFITNYGVGISEA